MDINFTTTNYTSSSVKLSIQSGASQAAGDTGSAKTSAAQDTYVPSQDYTDAANNAKIVEQMKSSLQSTQQKLFDMVNDILSKQGMQATVGEGAWKILSEGNFQVDAETKAAARQAISEDGEWGVKQTSQRLVNFAKALTGGDKSMVETMRDAFIKGYEAAAKAWGGELPEICKQTYEATMKLFDEWAGKDEETAGEAPAETASGVSGFTFEYEYTRVTSSSYSITANSADAEALESSGLFSDVSDPLKFNGMTLKSDWCMNEKVSLTVTVNANYAGASPAAPGRDSFVRREPANEDFGAYGRNGRRVGHTGRGSDRGEPRAAEGRDMTLTFIKPLALDTGGKQESLRVGGQDIPLHEDGTITVGMPDGTLRRATPNQDAFDRMTQNHMVRKAR